jgi:hypothetical protein
MKILIMDVEETEARSDWLAKASSNSIDRPNQSVESRQLEE